MNDNAMERWSEAEEAFLRENFGKLTYGEIAEKLGRTKRAVCHKAFKLGFSADAYAPWKQEEVDFLRENFSSMSSLDLAVRLKKTVHAVRRKAHKLGLRRDMWSSRPLSRKAWTKEEEASLREMAATMTSVEIARRMERTVASILCRCCRLGIKLPVGKSIQAESAWPPEKIARLRAGAEAGESLSLLADACGKTAPAVLKALRRFGIQRAELSQTKPCGRPRGSKTQKEKVEKRTPYEIPEGWISRKDAEAVVGVCKDQIGALCRSGKLEGRKVGQGCWIVLRESAERYAEERRAEVERMLAARLSAHVEKKKPAQNTPKRRKQKNKLEDEAQVAAMSKLDILKALAGL